MTSHFLIPSAEELTALLDLRFSISNLSLFDAAFLSPLNQFMTTGGKHLRAEILDLGFLFSGGQPSLATQRSLHLGAQVIEGLHVGSMIIDDIQDDSEVRRGQPPFHRQVGLANALNAGNWLYFQAISQIQKLGLEPDQEVLLQRYLNQIILRAHLGQAIDLGTEMALLSQKEVSPVCWASMELKTGALMALAFDLGAFIASRSKLPTSAGSQFARQFGIALQMFDDVGNFLAPPPKGREDFRNGRPSFVWAVASELCDESGYVRWIQAIRRLPDESGLDAWADQFNLTKECQKRASGYLWKIFEGLTGDVNSPKSLLSKTLRGEPHLTQNLLDRVERLFLQLEKSYV